MKYLTILTCCVFLMSVSVLTFAADPAEVKQPEQEVETEAAEEGKLMMEAKELPSTLITDREEESKVSKEVEELKEKYIYDEDPGE